MAIKVSHLDHLVMTVNNIDKTCEFYEIVLGMKTDEFKVGRKALVFGHQKINLHRYQHEFEPKAARPLPGCQDLCFIVEDNIDHVIQHLNSLNIPIELGPVERTGAQFPILSVYIRDPDNNLIELSVRIQ